MKNIFSIAGKSSTARVLFLLLYVVIGLYLYTIDREATVMYLTVFPIQFLFVLYGLKSKNMLLLVFFLEMFIAQGINPVFFFVDREVYSPTGFGAVGNYDFSLSKYFTAYSYIFIICISMVAFDYLFFKKRRKKDLLMPYLRNLTHKFQSYENPKFLTYMILFTILMSILSIWMYSKGIGVLGLKVVVLPFHLTGILVNFRRYIASLIIVYFFFKCKPKSLGYIILLIYGVIMSVSGCSKSIAAISFFPLIFYYFIEKQYGKSIIALILYAFIYNFVTISRTFIYETAEISYDFVALLEKTYMYMSTSDTNYFVKFLSSLSGRFYGSNVIVLMDQQNVTSFEDMATWYLTGQYKFSIIDMHGFSLDQNGYENFAFGIGVGMPGFLVLLSCHNYLLAFIQAVIIVLFHHSFYSNVQRILACKPKSIIAIITCGLLGLSVQNIWNAGPYILDFYLCLLGIYAIRLYCENKKPRRKFQYVKN